MSKYDALHALHIGTVLEGALYKYKIKKVLGQGSFGITYLANVQMKGKLGTLDSNMTVAIKEFYMRDINGRDGQTVTSGSKGGLFDEYKKKFEREANNLSKLEHPNIVKVLESFEANGTIYYVMEYIDGVSLDKKIEEKKRLDYKTCIKYTKQIGSALSFMHKEHMLHLDVKPANVMLRKSDDAVLIDFGLSKQYDENGEPESSTKVGGGTPGYAPLEQANYHEGKDFPVVMDVYALGGTMFKMLSGCRPPEASDILNDGFPEKDLKMAKVPQKLIGCIAKAMNPTKKNRYQTIASFIDVLESIKTEIEASEETTVEESVVDIATDEEVKIVNVQNAKKKTYKVRISNNGQELPSVLLSDKIHNLQPQKWEVDIPSKDFTYQQVIDGHARGCITANVHDDVIILTYRFPVKTKTIHFKFTDGHRIIPIDTVRPSLVSKSGVRINIATEKFTFHGKEIFDGPYTVTSANPQINIAKESSSINLDKGICFVIGVSKYSRLKLNFPSPNDRPKVIFLHNRRTGQEIKFFNVESSIVTDIPGEIQDWDYTIKSDYYENESGHLPQSYFVLNRKIIDNHRKKRYVKTIFGVLAVVMLIGGAYLYFGNKSTQSIDSEPIQETVQHQAVKTTNGKVAYYWTGILSEGKPNGEGIMTYPSNDKDGRKEYKGYVSQGLRDDDSAVLTYINGNSYNGSFVNDKLSKGKLILKSDGMYFEGSFKDNQPYNGKWYYTDGSLYSTVTNGVEK